MPWHLARLLQGLAALQLAKQHGVEMAFGSDLLGDLHGAQLREFELRSRVLPPKVGRSRGGGAVFLGSRFTPNTSTQSRLGAGAAGGLQQGGGGGGLATLGTCARLAATAAGWQRAVACRPCTAGRTYSRAHLQLCTPTTACPDLPVSATHTLHPTHPRRT